MNYSDALRNNKRLWDIFTRLEEYHAPFRDQYDRFAYYMSQERDIARPEISEFLIARKYKIDYPHHKKFALVLTHDIDNVMLSRMGAASQSMRLLLSRKPGRSAKVILSRNVRRYNPLWNFDKIIALEKKYDASSSFYFLSLEKKDIDFSFDINNLKDELKEIIRAGFEVGLHGGHDAYNKLGVLLKEKDRLEAAAGAEVIGYRNHYLRFKVPTTWEMLKQAGFKYDTTFGYNDCVGFRNGMGHPYRPFNLETDRFIDLIEIPLIIMDRTLDTFMRLDTARSWIVIKRLLDRVRDISGAVSILWHNTDMQGEKLELYEKILSYGSENNAWLTSGRRLYDWWSQHDPIDIEKINESVHN